MGYESLDRLVEESSAYRLEPHTIESNGFSVTNYFHNGYFPDSDMTKGLRRVIIFPEQTMKKGVPNGSVWVFDRETPYNPNILKTDVGCGMTYGECDLDLSDSSIPKKLIDILKKNRIKIGRGNHFLDIIEGGIENPNKTGLLLHSDFNWDNEEARDYETAQRYIEHAKNRRREVLEKLFEGFNVEEGEIKYNWTHNAVEMLDDKVIYRKGSISLDENGGYGLLGLNPFDGAYLYAGQNPKEYNCMQHGVGKKPSGKANYSDIVRAFKDGKYEVWDISNSRAPNLEDEYQDLEVFTETFSGKQLPILGKPILKPKFVVYTG